MVGDRWIGVGDRVARALRGAYQGAVDQHRAAVGTVDVLAFAATQRVSPPLHVPRAAWQGLREIASGGNAPLRYAPGEQVAAGSGEQVAAAPGDEVEAVLREVEWRVRRITGRMRPADAERWDDRPRWTPAVRALVGGTLGEAHARGVTFAGLSHLYVAMLRMPDCGGARYLAPNAVACAAAAASAGRDRRIDVEAAPHPDTDGLGLSAFGRRGLGRRLTRTMIRLARVDPQFVGTTADIKAQAARLDHGVAAAGHAMLAMLRADACVRATDARVPIASQARNQGAPLLRAAGVDPYRLAAALAALAPPPEPGAAALAEQAKTLLRGDPFLAEELTAAEARAAEISLRHRHRATGTTHYLAALLDAPTAVPLLEACGVNATDLRARSTAALSAAPGAWR
ncbi:Clp protease N-terminal domain-containing protein [Asanoa siamensis]|uniref:Clp R domain-containing protein n=1 Tax=Asanoa siamensis TaxID=926357 RepID=A0ABQ4D4M6_9ACTN|nr:Clp protease N-terminal domain-containing protein [Asanoa siamensis]GIF78499.1 hypothetical protein Asi02nite_80170 [Asanoa siamensis]